MATLESLRARIGEEIGLSDWVRIDQPMIDAFAEATGDRQFIHVDPERAALTPFGGTVAHGFLTLSLLPMLAQSAGIRVDDARMGVNYGANRLRFLTPVRSGSRVRARFKLLELEEKRPSQWQQLVEVTVEIEDQPRPALIAEWITQIFL
ncbi:MaoC family dehydratase [Sphingomonas sp. 1P06PA]|uniref:MaoC family dehydratase n=1 Tax=Sphingomonas sp. 1P06PA TaxID=554121 RepID=UPI0039A4C387